MPATVAERVVAVALVPLWLTSAAGWAAWVALHRVASPLYRPVSDRTTTARVPGSANGPRATEGAA